MVVLNLRLVELTFLREDIFRDWEGLVFVGFVLYGVEQDSWSVMTIMSHAVIYIHAQLCFELPDFFYADSRFTSWAWIHFLFQCIENRI